MSIASQISRLQAAKTAIRAAIIAKGVSVPAESEYVGGRLSDYAGYIEQIPTIKTGTVTFSSDQTSSSTTIVDTSTIGFTPSYFRLQCNTELSTSQSSYISSTTFEKVGSTSYYVLATTMPRTSYSGTTTSKSSITQLTVSYLYMSNNVIKFYAASSYKLLAGTYTWYALP